MGGGISNLFSGTIGSGEGIKTNELYEQTPEYQAYENKVLAKLNELLSKYNNKDTDKINTHLEEILQAIKSRIDKNNLRILFGGSVSKHTYVDGLSDIDTLIVMNGTDLQHKSPNEIKNMLAKMLRERYPKTDISTGKLAVTVKFSDCEIQLLPAIRNKNNIAIPDGTGKGWSKINPQKFTEKLTEVNGQNGKKVIPVIKLVKSLIDGFAEKQKLSGYHVESLAVDVFKNYHGDVNTKAMLQHFFKDASQRVLSPIRDKTGQSVHVDDDLGNANSHQRQVISGALDRVYRRLSSADKTQSLEIWKDILE
jgi:hypothetical protein